MSVFTNPAWTGAAESFRSEARERGVVGGGLWLVRDGEVLARELHGQADLEAMMRWTTLEFEPGSRFGYSNPGIIVLGRIVELASGEPWERYVGTRILAPLGMDRSYFRHMPPDLAERRTTGCWPGHRWTRCGRRWCRSVRARRGAGAIGVVNTDHGLPPCGVSDYLQVMNSHDERSVGIAELKARLSAYIRRARRGETVTVYDRDTPVARLIPYEGRLQSSLPVRKASVALRDVKLPPPLGRDIGSLEALAEERQAGR